MCDDKDIVAYLRNLGGYAEVRQFDGAKDCLIGPLVGGDWFPASVLEDPRVAIRPSTGLFGGRGRSVYLCRIQRQLDTPKGGTFR